MRNFNKGDLFEYKHKISNNESSFYYCMYISDELYYFIDLDKNILQKSELNSAQYFSNLTKGNLSFIKNFDVENMNESDILNIILNCRNIVREEKIDIVLS